MKPFPSTQLLLSFFTFRNLQFPGDGGGGAGTASGLPRSMTSSDTSQAVDAPAFRGHLPFLLLSILLWQVMGTPIVLPECL